MKVKSLSLSDSSRPHGLQPTRLLRPWDFPGKGTGVGCHCLLRVSDWFSIIRTQDFHHERKEKLIALFSWQPTPVLLPGKFHGQRSLVGCSPWGREESDTTEQLPFQFSFSRIGEENGNPLQCSCLENLRDGGAWWAAVYGVAQSRT